jgi:hypothetical protein
MHLLCHHLMQRATWARNERSIVMRSASRRALACAVAFGALALPAAPGWAEDVASPAHPVLDGEPRTTEHVGDADPVRSAVLVSQARFPDGEAAHVVLASAAGFADALAGAPLLGAGPMLLSPPAALPPAVREELQRALAPGGTVYLLGGSTALSPAVEHEVRTASFGVRRLSGGSRVETAVAVATEVHRLFPDRKSIALARSDDWADSVSGGALAARRGMPLLIAPPGPLHPAVEAALPTFAAEELLIFGGARGVSDEAEEKALRAMQGSSDAVWAERISGADRAETAALIAMHMDFGESNEDAIVDELFPERFGLIDCYSTDGWEHGLPAASLAASLDMPLLLASADGLPEITETMVSGCLAAHLDVLTIGDPARLRAAGEAAAGCEDPRFLCDVWSAAELRPIVRPRWVFGMFPLAMPLAEDDDEDADEIDEMLDDEDLEGVCMWFSDELVALIAMQYHGREAFDEGRHEDEDAGMATETVKGFDGEAYRTRADEMYVSYTVYDGEWTWMVGAMSFSGPVDDEAVRTLTELLIERRTGG